MPKVRIPTWWSGLAVRSSATRSGVAPGRVTILEGGTTNSARRSAQTARKCVAELLDTVCGAGFSVPSSLRERHQLSS